MQRITITLDDDLMDDLDALIQRRGYASRSEALRDLARMGLKQATQDADSKGECMAALVYVYDHAVRDLSQRLTQSFHAHHDLAQSTLHLHLDHDTCMEVAILKGPAGEVRSFGDQVIAERSVLYGQLVTIPMREGGEHHSHSHSHSHSHPHPHPPPHESEGEA